ncbi:Nif11-like leader peptide family natural product precursor [Bradyrhizobium sp. UFLA05-112]
MSQTDVERFVDDLGQNGRLLENLKPCATGLAPIVAMGNRLGYNITLDEVKSCIPLPNRGEFTTEKVDAIAGRKQGSSVATSTSLVQSTALASSTVVPMNTVQVPEMAPSFAAVVLVVVVVIVVVE